MQTLDYSMMDSVQEGNALTHCNTGFSGSSVGKEFACNARDLFDSWVGKICWRRDRLPTPVFWPGKYLHSPRSHKESVTTESSLPDAATQFAKLYDSLSLFYFFLLKDNCLTEFCCFLSNITWISQGIHRSPPLEPPSHLPSHPTFLGWYRAPGWDSWAVQHISIGSLFYIR